MSQKNTPSQNNRHFRIINGGMNAESYGLGDPCVPIELSYFPEENPKSDALLKEVDALEDQVKSKVSGANFYHILKSVLPK